jgi:hypothetical protein
MRRTLSGSPPPHAPSDGFCEDEPVDFNDDAVLFPALQTQRPWRCSMGTSANPPNSDPELEKIKLRVEAWKATIDVQKHFNDLELRIRNFALTVLTAMLGAVGLGIQNQLFIRIGSFTTNLAVWFLGVGVVSWVAFGLMDGLWYHSLLKGAVAQGEAIENELANSQLGAFKLTTSISAASHKHVSSSAKMFLFYTIITVLLIVAMFVLHRGIQPATPAVGA